MAKWEETHPSEEYHQVLDADGEVVNEPPDLPDEVLRRMYHAMVQSREFDNKALLMQRRGEVSIIARATGEEAVSCGSAAALNEGDWCFPSYRQAPAMMFWGINLARNIVGLMGAEPETIEKHIPLEEEPPVNFTPAYVPLAVNVTNAVGSAIFDTMHENDTVSLSYIGDGSTSQGDFHEALNFAGVFGAPSVTVIQNNQWAISVPAHRQTAAETFAQKAEAHGVPHDRVDGNDVLAMYEIALEHCERARNGGGPGLIEAVTYRMVEHNTADDESVYRHNELAEQWAERDPIDRFETYLLDEGILGPDEPAEIRDDIQQEIEEAVDIAREVPESDPEAMFEHHLKDDSWSRSHQRQELHAEQRGENPFIDFTGEGLE